MTKKPTYVVCHYTTCGMENEDYTLITPIIGYIGTDMKAAVKDLMELLKDNVSNIIELENGFTLNGFGDDLLFEISNEPSKAKRKFKTACTKLATALENGDIDTIDCDAWDDTYPYHDVYAIVTK